MCINIYIINIHRTHTYGPAHAKHAMTVATLTFDRILWQSYCFSYSNWFFFNEYMVDLNNEELYHCLSTLGGDNTLNSRPLRDKMQILGLLEQYFNTSFKKFSMTKYLSFHYKKIKQCSCIFIYFTSFRAVTNYYFDNQVIYWLFWQLSNLILSNKNRPKWKPGISMTIYI